MNESTITVERHAGEDASQLAAQAAHAAGTRIAGNLRWYGPAVDGWFYRAATTEDGREVRVIEPSRDRCCRCAAVVETDSMVVRTDEAAGTVTLLCPACAGGQ